MKKKGRFLGDEKLCRALLHYHNKLSARDRLSPAQKTMVILYKIQFQLTPGHLPLSSGACSTEEVEKKIFATQKNTGKHYNKMAYPLPDIQQGSQVALQNPKN